MPDPMNEMQAEGSKASPPVDPAAVLVVGTHDTKSDELDYLASIIRAQGGAVVTMDVGVLRGGPHPVDYSRFDVADAAGSSIETMIAGDSEANAMIVMARGASTLVARLHGEARFGGVVVLGGSMGTDLALDLCSALPLGVPKLIVSTVSFSPLVPPERIPADAQMMLWAGGLYGLNSICRAVLSQAAGAVLGAVRAVEKPSKRPLIGMTSLGSSALRYMLGLKPALEARGFEVAVFHATGMGGRAFENLAASGAFACVFDFCTQEVGNHLFESGVSAGADRLTGAGRYGTPQLVAPGCCDLVDLVGWQKVPERFAQHECHVHNRLITSVVLEPEERCEVARVHARKLGETSSASVFLLPLGGVGEWDREGAPLHRPASHRDFCEAFREVCPASTELHVLEAHINDDAFVSKAIELFDGWLADGTVERPGDTDVETSTTVDT